MIRTFKRYELKYILNAKQVLALRELVVQHMESDKYTDYRINNLYLDTETNLLIRRSIDKPTYKEKLRVRFYNNLSSDSNAFIELKKKFDKVVYKRRISLPYAELMDMLRERQLSDDSQIAHEINYCLRAYDNLLPRLQLTYEREAFRGENELRLTIDSDICYKTGDIYNFDGRGTQLDPQLFVVEVKTVGGIPLWLVEYLSKNKIYKKSFSKYGSVYKKVQGERLNDSM